MKFMIHSWQTRSDSLLRTRSSVRRADSRGLKVSNLTHTKMKSVISCNSFISTVNSNRSLTSVLRILLQFASFGVKGRTLTQIRKKIDSAWASLSAKRALDTQISFTDVRECFLEVEDLAQSRAYVSRPHWSVSAGDIGYVMDDNFVLIANVFDDNTSNLCASHEEILAVRCDPCRPYNVTVLPDGWKRYVLCVIQPNFCILTR
jgi:hypothetical protein